MSSLRSVASIASNALRPFVVASRSSEIFFRSADSGDSEIRRLGDSEIRKPKELKNSGNRRTPKDPEI